MGLYASSNTLKYSLTIILTYSCFYLQWNYIHHLIPHKISRQLFLIIMELYASSNTSKISQTTILTYNWNHNGTICIILVHPKNTTYVHQLPTGGLRRPPRLCPLPLQFEHVTTLLWWPRSSLRILLFFGCSSYLLALMEEPWRHMCAPIALRCE